MKARTLFLYSIGIFICITLFSGKYISKMFLKTPIRIAGMTTEQQASAAIFLDPNSFTSGVIVHEMFHAFKNLRIIARDNPFAAAAEYFHDYRSGDIRDPKALKAIENVLEAQAHKRALMDSLEYFQQTFKSIDSLAENNLTGHESANTYSDAAQLAGLALSLTPPSPFYVTQMATGLPASLAWKSLSDKRYAALIDAVTWLRFFQGETVSYPDLLERAFEFALVALPQDLRDLEYFLSVRTIVDSAYALHIASSMRYIIARLKKNDFDIVYQLGSETAVRKTKSDTSGTLEGVLLRWSDRLPTYRLNSKMNTDSSFEYGDSLINYVRTTLHELQDVVRDSLPFEIGQYDRNTFQKGFVFLQPSNLIPNEAMTTVLLENYHVVSAVITFNSNINYFPIIAQEIWHSLGMLGHISPGKFQSIFQNPLPRPLPYFKNRSYEHFLSEK